jgi:hypothetical protein
MKPMMTSDELQQLVACYIHVEGYTEVMMQKRVGIFTSLFVFFRIKVQIPLDEVLVVF